MRDISASGMLGSTSGTAVAYTLDCVWSLVVLTHLEALSVCFCICIHPIIGTLHNQFLQYKLVLTVLFCAPLCQYNYNRARGCATSVILV